MIETYVNAFDYVTSEQSLVQMNDLSEGSTLQQNSVYGVDDIQHTKEELITVLTQFGQISVSAQTPMMCLTSNGIELRVAKDLDADCYLLMQVGTSQAVIIPQLRSVGRSSILDLSFQSLKQLLTTLKGLTVQEAYSWLTGVLSAQNRQNVSFEINLSESKGKKEQLLKFLQVLQSLYGTLASQEGSSLEVKTAAELVAEPYQVDLSRIHQFIESVQEEVSQDEESGDSHDVPQDDFQDESQDESQDEQQDPGSEKTLEEVYEEFESALAKKITWDQEQYVPALYGALIGSQLKYKTQIAKFKDAVSIAFFSGGQDITVYKFLQLYSGYDFASDIKNGLRFSKVTGRSLPTNSKAVGLTLSDLSGNSESDFSMTAMSQSAIDEARKEREIDWASKGIITPTFDISDVTDEPFNKGGRYEWARYSAGKIRKLNFNPDFSLTILYKKSDSDWVIGTDANNMQEPPEDPLRFLVDNPCEFLPCLNNEFLLLNRFIICLKSLNS